MAKTILSPIQAYKYARDNASASQKQEMLCSLYVPDDPAFIADCRKRIYANDATDEDKWLDFKATYLEAWGIKDVDQEFVEKHGCNAAASKKVTLLMRLLFPEFHRQFLDDDAIRMADKVDALKVTCVAEMLEALGVRHPFDADTQIADYWNNSAADPVAAFESSPLFLNVTAFREYEKTLALFRGEKVVKKKWDRQLVTKTINSVLNAVGLSLKVKNHQVRTAQDRVRQYTYYLESDDVDEMKELVAIKLDAMGGRGKFRGNGDVDMLIRDTTVERHARLLVCRVPPPRTSEEDAEPSFYDKYLERAENERANVLTTISASEQRFCDALRAMLGADCEVVQSDRPRWLRNPETGHPLELDMWIPAHDVAIEYDGPHHYVYPNMYHRNREEFDAQRRRDASKDEQCLRRGIRLLRVRGDDGGGDVQAEMDQIRDAIVELLDRRE